MPISSLLMRFEPGSQSSLFSISPRSSTLPIRKSQIYLTTTFLNSQLLTTYFAS
ncbi:hypothetical protein SLEP1_g27242 [Rubroshorea leprosula]|uniref:Uncharacterized protein n=1 Tax=Rubroshorea leprosula TaxID=152421 RepID=A0AAV5JYF3_9ROSI|nr:hypothetical protein SLEP1_g27242 [Rubroshorea leprosula]